MNKLCDWFDKYQDGELSPEQREQFNLHASVCEECGTKTALLAGLVHVLKQEEPVAPALSARKIAARIFERRARSWDLALLSFLRPVHAWSFVAALLILLSVLGVFQFVEQPALNTDYEALITSSDPAGSRAALTDDKLELWLEQGGNLQ